MRIDNPAMVKQYSEYDLKEIGKQCGNRLPPASAVQAMFLYEMQRESELEKLFQGQMFELARFSDSSKAQQDQVSEVSEELKNLRNEVTAQVKDIRNEVTAKNVSDAGHILLISRIPVTGHKHINLREICQLRALANMYLSKTVGRGTYLDFNRTDGRAPTEAKSMQ